MEVPSLWEEVATRHIQLEAVAASAIATDQGSFAARLLAAGQARPSWATEVSLGPSEVLEPSEGPSCVGAR